MVPAQDAAGQDTIEEIVVTGSRIKRRDFSSPSPITTIGADEIAFSGQSTLEETLNQLPQMAPDFGRTTNNPGNGTARMNLRGLGPGRTLVMLNARRLAPSGVRSAVDVNNVPQSLIERVEVITGGASTVYGSDAIAGVVNFITKEDFEGLSLDASYYSTGEGDSQTWDLNLAYGHNFSRGNLTVYAGTLERDSLFASEREITRQSLFNNFQTGEVQVSGSSHVPGGQIFFPPVDLGSGPGTVTFNDDGTPRTFIDPDDRYNFQEVNYLQLPLTRYNAGVFADFEVTQDHQIYVETSFSRNEADRELAPVPAIASVTVNLDNPTLTPETRQLFTDNYMSAPGLAEFPMGRRLREVGSRMIKDDRDYWRTVVGFRGELGRGWDFDAWYSYTKSDEKQFFVNDASFSRYVRGLLVDPATNECFDPTDGCVPLDVWGPDRLSPEAVDYLRITDVENDTSRIQQVAAVVVTGTPFESWAGPVDTAFGLEWRSDEASFEADEVLFTGDTLGFAGRSPVEGTESVFEAYGEALLPLLSQATIADYLGLEIGARYSEYQLAGGVWTWKAGGEWQPVEGVRFRAMRQKSVRAPNNAELFTKQFTETRFFVGNQTIFDPCSASADPVGNGNTEKCVIQGLDPDQIGIYEATPFYPADFTSGGNPDLLPEEAETLTLGVVISPEALANWDFAVDYYEMEVTDTIGDLDSSEVCFDPLNTGNLFCDNLTRDATGNVVSEINLTSNLGLLRSRGIDTQVNYARDLPDALALLDSYAQINVSLLWTHLLENAGQQNPVSTVIQCAGYFGFPCDFESVNGTFPENRITTNVNYASGPLSLHLTWRYIGRSDNAAPIFGEIAGLPDPVLAVPSIGSENYFDLGFGWFVTDDIRVTLNVNNLLDTEPPLMLDATSQNNTDTLLYDVFGRSFQLGVSARLFGQ